MRPVSDSLVVYYCRVKRHEHSVRTRGLTLNVFGLNATYRTGDWPHTMALCILKVFSSHLNIISGASPKASLLQTCQKTAGW